MMPAQLLPFIAGIGSVLALSNILGASAYDLRQINKQRLLRKHPHSRRYLKRPRLTLIVFAENNEKTIERCLNSLLKTAYRKLEIIIIDNASTDNTRKIARKIVKHHPRRTIRLIAKRRRLGPLQAISGLPKKFIGGGLIFVLKASDYVDKDTVKNAVINFNTETELEVLSLNFKVGSTYSTVGLFQKLEYLLRYRSKKFNSVTNSDYIIGGDGAMFSKAGFENMRRISRRADKRPPNGWAYSRDDNISSCSQYASNAIIHTDAYSSVDELLKQRYSLQTARLRALKQLHPGGNYTKLYIWFRLPLAVFTGLAAIVLPFLLTYVLYLAILLHQPTLLFAVAAITAVFIILAVWSDDQLKSKQKLMYSCLVPITYGIFYLVSFIQSFALLRAALPVTQETD